MRRASFPEWERLQMEHFPCWGVWDWLSLDVPENKLKYNYFFRQTRPRTGTVKIKLTGTERRISSLRFV